MARSYNQLVANSMLFNNNDNENNFHAPDHGNGIFGPYW